MLYACSGAFVPGLIFPKNMIVSRTTLNIVRLIFLLLSAFVAVVIINSFYDVGWYQAAGIGGTMAAVFILLESRVRHVSLRAFSYATIGLLVGLLCAKLVCSINLGDLLYPLHLPETATVLLKTGFAAFVHLGLSYIGVMLALRSQREDFAMLIPYVRFREDSTTGQLLLVDAELLCDGRLPALLASGFLHGRILLPEFISRYLHEQLSVDDYPRRMRAERGMEQLRQLRQDQKRIVPVSDDESIETLEPQYRLLELAKQYGARLVTLNPHLGKLAETYGVQLLDINLLMNALQPRVQVGEQLGVHLLRTGKEEHQAVGYLADGSLIVVNNAKAFIGSLRQVRITSVIPSGNGRLIFAELMEDIL